MKIWVEKIATATYIQLLRLLYITGSKTMLMHKHHWECTDTPGIFMCHAEGQTGYFNSLTKEITEDVD